MYLGEILTLIEIIRNIAVRIEVCDKMLFTYLAQNRIGRILILIKSF